MNSRLNLIPGLSRASIFQQVEASLQRLGTSYIDVLQIHRFDHHVSPEETMKALHDLIKMDKIRYIGASSMWAHEFALLQHTTDRNNWTKFICMQNHYSLTYREEEREMIKYCDLTGVGVISVSQSRSQTEVCTNQPQVGTTWFWKVGKTPRSAVNLCSQHSWNTIRRQ